MIAYKNVFEILKKRSNIMPFNQNFYTYSCKKKPLNLLISLGDSKGHTGFLGHTVYFIT